MWVVLCESCGHVMGRHFNRCVLCKKNNLAYYPDITSQELKNKVSKITGQKKLGNPLFSSLLAATITTIVVYAIYFLSNDAANNTKVVNKLFALCRNALPH